MLGRRPWGSKQDGSFPDWVELQNVDEVPIDLGTVTLSDTSGAVWTGPAGTVLQPGERTLILADDQEAVGRAPFGISDDEVLLLSIDGTVVDEVQLPDLPEDVAFARTPEGGPFARTLWATPGAPNPETASPTVDPSDPLFGDAQVLELAIEVAPEDEAALDVRDGEGVPAALVDVCDVADALEAPTTYLGLLGWLDPWVVADPRNHDSRFRVERHREITAFNLQERTSAVREQVAAATGFW